MSEEDTMETVKVESSDEADSWDPLSDAVPKETGAASQSNTESIRDKAKGAYNPAQGQTTAGGSWFKVGRALKSKCHAKPGFLKALDVDESSAQACKALGGGNNCVRKWLQSNSDIPDPHAADWAAKRKEINLQIVLEGPEELSQLPHKAPAKNHISSKLKAAKKALTRW
ncbi:hypothetical protein FRC10_001288 [Ceratobasidium sp. 414]|nr:hypothetical protein FRC10_001288 [Ceratobasidium sp. 414]